MFMCLPALVLIWRRVQGEDGSTVSHLWHLNQKGTLIFSNTWRMWVREGFGTLNNKVWRSTLTCLALLTASAALSSVTMWWSHYLRSLRCFRREKDMTSVFVKTMQWVYRGARGSQWIIWCFFFTNFVQVLQNTLKRMFPPSWHELLVSELATKWREWSWLEFFPENEVKKMVKFWPLL